MALEAITFPSPPTLTNGNDGNQDYNLGYRFSADAAVPCVGVRWVRTPDAITSTPNLGNHVASLWTVVGETRVRFANFVPVPASDNQDILFLDGLGDPNPFMLDPGALYVVAIFSRDYVFRSSGGVENTSPSGTLTGDEGKLAASGDPTSFPASTQASWYYVSPIVDIPSDTAEGEGALGLDLAVAATGGADAEGSAALGLGLAVAASGSSPAQGAVALTLGLAPAAAGERTSQGAAAVGLGLAVAASGERAARGSAALGLNLAVAATGSNGEAGCPVSPWPWTPRVAAGYSWAARPVKSFPGGECS
jgi:hypothetical protein